jgi:hypothetical protein
MTSSDIFKYLKCDIASAKLNASLGMICMGYELSLTRRFHSLAVYTSGIGHWITLGMRKHCFIHLKNIGTLSALVDYIKVMDAI